VELQHVPRQLTGARRRRQLLAAGASAAALAACGRWRSPAPELGPIAAMFPGRIDDGGANEAAYRGLLRIRDELGIPVTFADRVPANEESMKAALRELAESDARMVIANGGRTNAVTQRVAWEFPAQRFTVIQGDLTRPNLAIYAVAPEQSVWLAGAAAGLLTKSNVVGQVAGPRDPAGLKLRAAFAGGLAYSNPKAKLLTSFAGAPDNPAAAQRIALAQIDAGADILYVMLDAGPGGAIQAGRARGVPLIGDVRDWVAVMPDAFVASAVADPGFAVFQAGRDLFDNIWQGDLVRRYGVRDPDAVRLALAPRAPEPVRARVAGLTRELAVGSIKIPEAYGGPEFAPA
jgi:basic membrane protein A